MERREGADEEEILHLHNFNTSLFSCAIEGDGLKGISGVILTFCCFIKD